jgi:hypothetical protein
MKADPMFIDGMQSASFNDYVTGQAIPLNGGT